MMKTSEEILLEEVKAEYTRQLTNWDELDRKSHNFLQLNGLLLSIIFIGISFTINSVNSFPFPFLLGSTILIIISSVIITIFVIRVTGIKEINIHLDDKNNLENKEKDIILSLIKVYNIAQNDIMLKHNIRAKNLALSTKFLLGGFFCLLLFIIEIHFSKIIL